MCVKRDYCLFQAVKKSIKGFIKHELERFQRILSSECMEYFKMKSVDGEEQDEWKRPKEAFLDITLHVLREIKQERLADSLKNSKNLKGPHYFNKSILSLQNR